MDKRRRERKTGDKQSKFLEKENRSLDNKTRAIESKNRRKKKTQSTRPNKKTDEDSRRGQRRKICMQEKDVEWLKDSR